MITIFYSERKREISIETEGSKNLDDSFFPVLSALSFMQIKIIEA